MVESLPSKQAVAGSNPVSRSSVSFHLICIPVTNLGLFGQGRYHEGDSRMEVLLQLLYAPA